MARSGTMILKNADRMENGGSPETLGTALRRVRKTTGLTLESAAGKADVTKGYLSKVESGQATPSMRVIIRLSEAYGVPLSDILMPDDQRRPISVVRAGERSSITRNGTELGYIFEIATRLKLNPRAEVFFVTVPAQGKGDEPRFKHTGEEIFLVLEGRVRFSYGGTDFILNEGDCAQFDASMEHRSVAEGESPAKLFVVTIPDRLERTKS